MIDPVSLTQALIRRPSVTPADAGAMDIVEQTLSGLGFACRRMTFGQIENLYARYGSASPNSALPATPTWCRWGMLRPGAGRPLPPTLSTTC